MPMPGFSALAAEVAEVQVCPRGRHNPGGSAKKAGSERGAGGWAFSVAARS